MSECCCCREVVEEIAALRAELRELRQDLTHAPTSKRAGLSRAQRSRLETLLPAVNQSIGDEQFATRDLLAADAHPAVRQALKGVTAKSLGHLLAKAEGLVVAGYEVRRVDKELGVSIWSTKLLEAAAVVSKGF